MEKGTAKLGAENSCVEAIEGDSSACRPPETGSYANSCAGRATSPSAKHFSEKDSSEETFDPSRATPHDPTHCAPSLLPSTPDQLNEGPPASCWARSRSRAKTVKAVSASPLDQRTADWKAPIWGLGFFWLHRLPFSEEIGRAHV